ncbi:MAG: aldose 1-epimerase family protein [Parafilimonas sp.]
MIQISNNKLSVTISEEGAELQSIQLNNIEYLWQANNDYWGKHAPVLFPIVGELKDGKYIFNNKEYKLPRHGFARNKTFESNQTSASSAIFTLHSSEETLPVFPFHFIFQVEYKITDTTLSCMYHVQNTGTDIMYFSVGGHPAFNVPLQTGLLYTDYMLEFNNDDVLHRYLLQKGLTGNDVEEIPLNNKRLQLRSSLFYADAIVLKHIKSNQIKLYSDKDAHGLKFKFDGFPYFGIWAAIDAPFVCLEPWCGIADNMQHDYELTHKEGINKLPAGENWQKTWSVELF